MKLFNLLYNQIISIATSATDGNIMPDIHEVGTGDLNLCNYQHNQKYFFEPEIVKGTSTFIKNETTIASLEKYVITGMEGNTCSNSVDINFYLNSICFKVSSEIKLSKDSKGEIELLNLQGLRIQYLTNQQNVSAGILGYSPEGTSTENGKVFSGIYYVRINLNGIFLIKKLFSTDNQMLL